MLTQKDLKNLGDTIHRAFYKRSNQLVTKNDFYKKTDEMLTEIKKLREAFCRHSNLLAHNFTAR